MTTLQELVEAGLKPKRPISPRSWLNDRIARSHQGPFLDIIDLTPDLAREILAKNDDNRRVSAETFEKYVRDITDGDWVFNGQTIVIAIDGHLNDGQHRCLAVIEANKSIKTAIAFGLPRESRLTLDQGKARRVSDYLDMSGYTETSALACAAGFLWQYEKYGSITTQRNNRMRPTKAQIMGTIEGRPDLLESIKATSGYRSIASRGMLAFFRTILMKLTNENDVDEFFDKLVKGVDLSNGDPILYARNRLINAQQTGNLRAPAKVELLIRAWNAHRRGMKVRTLSILGEDTLPKIEK